MLVARGSFANGAQRLSIGYIPYRRMVPLVIIEDYQALSKSKWVMKQYWRVGTTRAWMSLGLGMFSLGKIYYVYIPSLVDLGLLGALILGGGLVLLFLGIGWLYDAKGMMWSAKLQAAAERNPYRYVPDLRSFAIDYASTNAMLLTIRSVFLKLGLDVTFLEESIEYLDSYYGFNENKKDIVTSERMAAEFMKTHPLFREAVFKLGKVSLGARIKKWFEVQILRLSWVQQLTGMAQDALVFGAIYVVFLFPDATTGNVVPLNYLFMGLILISLPLFTLIATIGWLYDRKLRIWSVDTAVKVERNPFSYVAEPRLYSLTMPIYYTLFETLREVFATTGVEATEVQRILDFMDDYGCFRVSKESDMRGAINLRKSFGETFQQSQGVN